MGILTRNWLPGWAWTRKHLRRNMQTGPIAPIRFAGNSISPFRTRTTRTFSGYGQTRALHFSDSVNADLAHTVAAWYLGGIEDGYNQETGVQGFGFTETETCTFEAWIEDPGEQQPIIPWLSEVVWHISRFNTPASSPFAFVLMSVPIYLWLTLFAFVRCIITRHRAVQSASSLAVVGSPIRVFM
jgi:hypothetical protein